MKNCFYFVEWYCLNEFDIELQIYFFRNKIDTSKKMFATLCDNDNTVELHVIEGENERIW